MTTSTDQLTADQVARLHLAHSTIFSAHQQVNDVQMEMPANSDMALELFAKVQTVLTQAQLALSLVLDRYAPPT